MSNQSDGIKRALDAGDVYKARQEYANYATSMERQGQTPKDPTYFGIPKQY